MHFIYTQMDTGQNVGHIFSEGFDTQVRGVAWERNKKSLSMETRAPDTTYKPLLHWTTYPANATLFNYAIKFWYKLTPPYIHRLERIHEAGFN